MLLSSTFAVALSALPFVAYATPQASSPELFTTSDGDIANQYGFMVRSVEFTAATKEKLELSLKEGGALNRCGAESDNWQYTKVTTDVERGEEEVLIGPLSAKPTKNKPLHDCLRRALSECTGFSEDKITCRDIWWRSVIGKRIVITLNPQRQDQLDKAAERQDQLDQEE